MADVEVTTEGHSLALRPDRNQAEASSWRSSVPARSDAGHSSTSRDSRPAHLSADLHREDPWQPIVLSLDGGGIRGLSSLYILQHLMQKVMIEEERQERESVPNELDALAASSSNQSHSAARERSASDQHQDLRPCHYFDFMIGTSTGGLIAVLLGRLRLDIDTCIRIYEQIGTYIFGSRRWWGLLTKYDHRRMKRAIKKVLQVYCEEHAQNRQCRGDDLLRQYDFSHHDGPYKNHSCKVALMSIREGDRRHHTQDKQYLFRSYDHVKAPPEQYNRSNDLELNPGTVQDNATTIWEACRATSAAPLYFNKMTIRGVRYMDGGVGANNPAGYALNEAQQMTSRGGKADSNRKPAALISVGTGHKDPQSRFRNIFDIITWARKRITDTEEAHINTEGRCKELNVPYCRFDVQEGLSKMKLDECRQKKAKKVKKDEKGKMAVNGDTAVKANGDTTGTASPKAGHATAGKPLFNTWQPDRYEYVTYKRIKEDTIKYCQNKGGSHDSPVDVDAELTKAAQLLVYYRRRREELTPEAWTRFRDHPYTRITSVQRNANSEAAVATEATM
ncbi:FabD/lysophospholipase-like protein [Paraphaeosphaeria sporulosa]|uniref:FabD/lysophospholipase-like protein n=1 Tax=Paraphaeosphaeria sporulosa TaxID=1460663 RepID=A0A177CQ94_9PLEO|nr:FabD/lysophospholipase-like protein [Paraphaeosphaeria sporulosa]OAG09112.1 FabD/lysophospholipase-like protein [Paraphaeosphaeria sporulosa]